MKRTAAVADEFSDPGRDAGSGLARSAKLRGLAGHIAGIGLGALFVYAGVLKLLDPVEFYRSVLNYRLLEGGVAWVAALFLPWLEVASGLGVALPWTRRGGLAWLVLLLLAFQAGLISAWVRGLDIDCGCFGEAGASAPIAVARNLFLLAAAGFVAWTEVKPKSDPS